MSEESTSNSGTKTADNDQLTSIEQSATSSSLIIMQSDSSELTSNSMDKMPKIVIQQAPSKKRPGSIDSSQYQSEGIESAKYARLELVQPDAGAKSYENLENALNSVTTQQSQAQPTISVQYTQVNPIQVPPKLTHTSANTEEIYQLLSQKIAKYCQVLSDLTNCEVFFKSTLSQRSLYWGTYKMMYNYSHQGLHYDRNESLIKIMGRSLSNDVNNIVEELLAPENLDETSQSDTGLNTSVNYTILSQRQSVDTTATSYTPVNQQNTIGGGVGAGGGGLEIATALTPSEIDEIDIKDCVVFVERIDDGMYEEYLQKLEKSRTYLDDDASVIESENGENEIEQSGDAANKVQSNDDMFICELCADHSYKHLPQLKMHVIREHEKVEIGECGPYECVKCHASSFDSKEQYCHHLLLCFYPDLYTCKMCQQAFDSYSDYQFHTRYIHTQAYVCSMCNRKFKNVKELVDHDQLMHAKSLIYCEICYEQMKSRSELYRHYKSAHVANLIQSDTGLEVTVKEASKVEEMILDAATGNQLNITAGSVISLNDSTSIIVTEETAQTQSQILTPTSLNTTRVQKNDLIRGLLDRKHQCKWCTQRFYTKAQLKQHESTHVNAVLFCPVCDKEFTHKDRLAGHMKCHMEPSLECKICGKKFKRLCNLYNHELVHGLTEHAFMLCQFCGRGFRSRRDYQNHVIANHRDQLMKSEVIMKNGGGNSAASPVVQKNAVGSNQDAKALFMNQMTPIVTSSKGTAKGGSSKRSSSSQHDNSFTYFTHLTHGSNNSVAFDDENEMDDEENMQNLSATGDDMDENVQESKQQQAKSQSQAQLPLHNHVTRSQKKAAAAAAAAQSAHSSSSSSSSSNNLNNAQLLVQAAEFVDNQSA